MNSLYETKPCTFCGLRSTAVLDAARLAKWEAGEYVQTAFDNLNASERELIMTGTHPSCWDEAFGTEEKE